MTTSVARRSPETVAASGRSYTGHYLKPLLARQAPARVEDAPVKRARKRVAA